MASAQLCTAPVPVAPTPNLWATGPFWMGTISHERLHTSQMEDLDPDLVRDMKTLSSLMITRCTSFNGERSFFLDTSWRLKGEREREKENRHRLPSHGTSCT